MHALVLFDWKTLQRNEQQKQSKLPSMQRFGELYHHVPQMVYRFGKRYEMTPIICSPSIIQ